MTAITTRLATDDDGARIRGLTEGAGVVPLGLDFSKVAGFWVVAEIDGAIMGCVQSIPALPLGCVEFLAVDARLTQHRKARVIFTLVMDTLAMQRAQGVQTVMWHVPEDLTGYRAVLHARGAAEIGRGRLMVRGL